MVVQRFLHSIQLISRQFVEIRLTLYNEVLPEFEKFNAQLIGISVDGVWSHVAFQKIENCDFPFFLILSLKER